MIGQGQASPWATLALLGLAIAAIGIAWQLGYSHTVFVPPPADVWEEIRELVGTSSTYDAILDSLVRLAAGMAIGTGLGLVAGLAGIYSSRLEGIARAYTRITFVIPSLMAAFLALVVFGISSIGVIVTVAVIVFPFVTTPILDGVSSRDRSLDQMTQVYRASRFQQVRHVVLPYITPYLISGVRNAHSLGWRILIVAEVFSVRSGIGYQFHVAFDTFRLAEVLAWLLFLLIVIGAIEFAVLRPLEDWTLRWRRTGTRGGGRRPGRTLLHPTRRRPQVGAT
ncbi:MAG TPA: ABC transporter permease subunit [Solirubrobacter sp.]|jgi:ABC-type nitrate/sulfonate/bicarbonate transport system permease component|nr:ABC transporter permease subunit [Solirubrobacter sp.]